MTVCGYCKRENEPHFRFCLECGNELGPANDAPANDAPANDAPTAERAPRRPGAKPRATALVRCGYCDLKVPANAVRCPSCNGPL